MMITNENVKEELKTAKKEIINLKEALHELEISIAECQAKEKDMHCKYTDTSACTGCSA